MASADLASAAISESEHKVQLRRAVIAATIGTAIEWYDFFLYSTVTGLVFAKLYFPNSDPWVGTLEAFGIYAVGFIARPIGAAIFGHSMGGHGVWHLGVTYPDKWAAIGPSAGWISMFSYAGARKAENPSPMQEIFQRCMNPSDTVALAKNLKQLGVYVLHGDKDDNVPEH